MSNAVNGAGMRVARLVCVLGDDSTNSNKYYNFQQVSDAEFEATWGRVGGSESKQTYPMSQWDKIYRSKTSPSKKPKPYTDVTELYASEAAAVDKPAFEIVSSKRDPVLREVVKRLLGHAKKSVAANYTVGSDVVTTKQVERAQSALDSISGLPHATAADVLRVNDMLQEFFTIVPRKMKNVRDHLIPQDDLGSAAKLFSEIVANEQNTLDVMAGQVSLARKSGVSADSDAHGADALELIGLSADLVKDAKELAVVRGMMQSKGRMLKTVFRVDNSRTRAGYEDHLGKAANKKNDLFWHGSRTENWWNILDKGLLIRPTGAVYTGSMFGDGVYFASEFDKSLGYTSISSSRWAGGSERNAFLALYRVHLGKQYVTESSDPSLGIERLRKLGGYDSTHGKKGRSLMRDEYIVYRPQQCTVEYLVEVEGSQH